MTDFATVRGFEELWRPVARHHVADRAVLAAFQRASDAGGRLTRLAQRAPEVLVKITGKTHDAGHLMAHLAYIARDGALPLEGRDGELLTQIADVRELGADWAMEDVRKRADASLSISIVLSMPAGTNILGTRDAARAFAQATFGDRYDYVFALHTDAGHPHVHLAVRSLGEDGVRLNPRKADLELWRQTFAAALRARGIVAEATPRRSRGVVRKAERMPVRKLRERHERGKAELPRVMRAALGEANAIARGAQIDRPWEPKILAKQKAVRTAYIEAARTLSASANPDERSLALQVLQFVRSMSRPVTWRNELVKAVRSLNRDIERKPSLAADREVPAASDPAPLRRR